MKLLFASIFALVFLYMGVSASTLPRRVVSVYYPNWVRLGANAQNQEVRDLPWDRIDIVNHAFWSVFPCDDEEGLFRIRSIDDWFASQDVIIFEQYREMKELFPDVHILISLGGWGRSEYFGPMVATEEGRRSFIESCIETLRNHPYISGFDIDWEFPTNAAERDGFTLVMRELRHALTESGFPDAVLTFCAATSEYGNRWKDFYAVMPYVDRINIMTYDMAGSWDNPLLARHHTALFPHAGAVIPRVSASEAVRMVMNLGVPAYMINIGTPLYSRGWIVPGAYDGWEALGARAVTGAFGTQGAGTGQLYWYQIQPLIDRCDGWEVLFDDIAKAAFLFNSNPDSPYFQHFYTYESEESLQAKLDFIVELGLGGLIVWETAGDCMARGFPMLTQMAYTLHQDWPEPVVYVPEPDEPEAIPDEPEEQNNEPHEPDDPNGAPKAYDPPEDQNEANDTPEEPPGEAPAEADDTAEPGSRVSPAQVLLWVLLGLVVVSVGCAVIFIKKRRK